MRLFRFFNRLFVVLLLVLGCVDQSIIAGARDEFKHYQKLYDWATDIGDISIMSWSPDGQWLAAGSFSGFLDIFETSDGHILDTITVAGGQLRSLDWRPDGSSTLATGGNDGVIRFWNTQTGDELCHFAAHGRTLNPGEGNPNGVSALRWSPDGRSIASSGYDGTTRLTVVGATNDCNQLQPHILSSQNPFGVLDVDWNAEGDQFLSVEVFNGLPIWDVKTEKQLDEIECYDTNNFCSFVTADWSPNGKYIVASGDNGAASFSRIWDVVNHTNRDLISLCTTRLRWMPERYALVGWCEGQLQIWDAETLQLIAMTDKLSDYEEQYNPYLAYAISPDEQRIAINYRPAASTAIQIWGTSPKGGS